MKTLARSMVGLILVLLGACATAPEQATAPEPAQSPAIAALLAQASQAATTGHAHRAEGLLERGLRIEPQNATLWHALAALRLAEAPDEARALAAKSNGLTADPRLQAQNWHLIAKAWAAEGHPHRAAMADSRAEDLSRE